LSPPLLLLLMLMLMLLLMLLQVSRWRQQYEASLSEQQRGSSMHQQVWPGPVTDYCCI
jgi:hypothetical protein